MPRPIDPNWNFLQAIEIINLQFPPRGLIGPQLRNRQMEAWGQLVGRTRALAEFDAAVEQIGSITALGREFNITVRTLKGLRQFYSVIPDNEITSKHPDSILANYRLTYGDQVEIEETRQYEFKDISDSRRPGDSIKNTADEYVVSFLNSEGGSIFWGIRNQDRVIVGVRLSYRERDDVRSVVSQKLIGIRPSIDPTAYRIDFHDIYDSSGCNISDLCVIEITVPRIFTTDPYFTSGDEAFVRVDGVKRKLSGPALTDWIKRRLAE